MIDEGRPSFNILQNHGSSKAPVLYFVFDVTVLAGRDVMQEPLIVHDVEAPPAADAMAEVARRTRPDLAQARLQIDNTRALLIGTRNARLPALDAIATFRSNGLAVSINPLTLAGAAAPTAAPELLGGRVRPGSGRVVIDDEEVADGLERPLIPTESLQISYCV